MRTLLLLLLLLPAVAFARHDARDLPDTLDVLQRASASDVERQAATAPFLAASSLAKLYTHAPSLSQLTLRVAWREEQQALLQPLGDGALGGGIYADSYRRLNDRSAVWADARYLRGSRRNVCWNATSDYLLLYPYVVADTVGGALSTEEYAFGGGYTRRIGRIGLALRGDYRAGQEYRQVDPRPHNVVSDFTLKLSAGVEWGRYTVGVDLQGRLYKQQQSIAFYDPRGANTAVLFMTGLGGYVARYSGTRLNNQVAYDSKGYRLAAQLMPRNVEGWYLRTSYGDFETEQNYVPNNSIPVTLLQTREAALTAAYRSDRWSIGVESSYERRRGIEMVADRNGQGKIVDRQAMYRNRTWQAAAGATIRWQRSVVSYALRPRIEGWYSDATYRYPARRMTLARLEGAVRGDAEWLCSRWRVKATAGVGYSLSPDERISLAGIEQRMSDYLTATASRLSESCFVPELSLRGERRLGRLLACFAETGWMPRFYRGGLSEHRLTVACGMLF